MYTQGIDSQTLIGTLDQPSINTQSTLSGSTSHVSQESTRFCRHIKDQVSINTHESVDTQSTINYQSDIDQDVNGVSIEMSIDVQSGLLIDIRLWMPWVHVIQNMHAGSNPDFLRLVFTSDGVVVGVVSRRVERYDLVKIKPTESEAEHWFCLCLRCLRSSENCIVGVASRSGRINQ